MRKTTVFEIKIVERVIIQIRQMAENRRHGFGAESGPAAATGFHTQGNGFTNIRLHTAQAGNIPKEKTPTKDKTSEIS